MPKRARVKAREWRLHKSESDFWSECRSGRDDLCLCWYTSEKKDIRRNVLVREVVRRATRRTR